MAHFGVQKAKSKAFVALAAAAAIGSAALSVKPASAAIDPVRIGDWTIEADGNIPAVEGGYSTFYDRTTYEVLPEEKLNSVHLLKDNDYFGCSTGSASLNVLLKNKEAFKTFVTDSDAADKMIRTCEFVTGAEKIGKVGYYNATFSADPVSRRNAVYTNGSGETFSVITDIDYDEEAELSVREGEDTVLVSQAHEQDGKLAFTLKPRQVGTVTLRYAKTGSVIDMSVYVVDANQKDAEGNVYYYNANAYRGVGGYSSVIASYIGTEDLDLPDVDVDARSDVSELAFGARASTAYSVAGEEGVAVGQDGDPLIANFKSLNDSLFIRSGSNVELSSEINKDILLERSTLRIMADSSQPGEERVRIFAYSLDDNQSNLIIEGGTYNNIAIASNNVTINGGHLKQKSRAYTAETDSLIRGDYTEGDTGSIVINGDDTVLEHEVEVVPQGIDDIWHNDTFALIHSYGTDVTINGGTFKSNGTILSGEAGNGGSPDYIINGGNFEAKHLAAYSNGWNGNLTINNGNFNTTDRFYVWDVLNGWESGLVLGRWSSAPEESSGLGDVSRYEDDQGVEHRHWGTSVQGLTRVLVEPTTDNMDIKGGDFTDGYNDEDGTGIRLDDDYGQVELDADSDGDGRKDVRVLPKETSDGELKVGEKIEIDVPAGYSIVEHDGAEYCSAEIKDNKLVLIGIKESPENGCNVKVSDKQNKIFDYKYTVLENDMTITNGTPISIPVGDTKIPEDLDGKNPEDLTWTLIDGNDYCSVSDKGEITAVKGGGVCHVRAYDPETNEAIDWTITTTEPFEIGVGESKKPTDIPEGAEDGEWSSDDDSVCTVSNDGTITGKKAGVCHVTLKIGDLVYTWTVTIKDNPNTLDKKQAITFSIAGAAIAGIGAMIASIKRFGRR